MVATAAAVTDTILERVVRRDRVVVIADNRDRGDIVAPLSRTWWQRNTGINRARRSKAQPADAKKIALMVGICAIGALAASLYGN